MPIATSVLLALLACGNVYRSSTPPAPDTLPATTAEPLARVPDPEGSVRVLTLEGWPLDLSDFEAQTGCVPTVASARTSYALWTATQEEPADVVLATSDISRRLIRDDVLQPINTTLVPSWGSVPERFSGALANQLEGTPFGVPLQWGPQGLLTRDDAFADPPDSWRVLYEVQPLADGSTTAGRVQAYEGPIALAESALTRRAHDPALQILDPWQLSKSQFRAAVKAVRQQRTVVDRYWQSPDQQVRDFEAGRVVAASSWWRQARALQQQGVDVTFTLPTEGATAWVVAAMIPRDAAHPGCAYRLAEHLIGADAQRSLAEAWASVPVRAEVCDSHPCPWGGADIDALHFWRSPDRRCELEEDCMAWHEWVGQYTLARGGL